MFGTVPAGLAGADLRRLLASAEEGRRQCGPERRGTDNLGVHLGVAIGALAGVGRDKLTLLIAEPLTGLGLWLEQLVAESTGKDGRGVVPVTDEPRPAEERIGADRLFLALGPAGGPAANRARELAESGHAALAVAAAGVTDLGRLFFVLEFAIAVAGWALGVNPSTSRTSRRRRPARAHCSPTGAARRSSPRAGGRTGTTPEPRPRRRACCSTGSERPSTSRCSPTRRPRGALERAVARLRAAIAARTDAATTFGYGPRYLHSTGQLHKGGPRTGRFLQLVRTPPEQDVAIPGAGYGFGDLLAAQADGDLAALRARGRPAVRVDLGPDPAKAVDRLAEALEAR